MSALWPSRVRDFTQPTWMIRANTCASGRNSSVEASSVAKSSLELVDGDAELEHEVAVGEHAALGPARWCPRCRSASPGPAGWRSSGASRARRRRCRRRAGSGRRRRCRSIDQTWLSSSRSARTSATRAMWSAPSATTARAPESPQDPGDLLGRGGLVDRHGDGAGEPDRVVEQRPLVAGLGDQGDPVAGLDAGGDQALGDRAHLGAGTRAAVTSSQPPARRAAAEHDGVAGLAGVGRRRRR